MLKQQPLIGFLFALTTAMAWGSLPVALKQVVAVMSVETIIGFRFLVATLFLLLVLGMKKKLPKVATFERRHLMWFVLGILGLAGNFYLFSSSLNYVEPAITQIFIHLSSFLMMFCGVFVFKEHMGLHQKIGLVILIVGLGFFFNDRLSYFRELNKGTIGIGLSIAAAISWVGYGLAQKILLKHLSSQQILLLIYFGCTLIFIPSGELSELNGLSGWALGCFLYCCANTLIGYGTYAEALNRWDVSKVSVVITLVPLFTIVFSHLAHAISPDNFTKLNLNALSYFGAFVVVFGTITASAGDKIWGLRR